MVSSRPSSASILAGRTLGDFVLEEVVGEGGFGVVYRARQPRLGRLAVVKVLHMRLRAAGDATERFLREARTASSLDHPYAAHIYSSGAEPDGTLWIAMEYVRGTTLSEYLQTQGPLPLERFIPLLERLCEVVHSAHEQGIVHRDIKPANVMVLSRSGRLLPKLLDFGISKAILESAGDARAAARPADVQPPQRASLAETVAPDSPVGLAETAATGDHGNIPAAGEAPLASGELTHRGQIIGSPYYMAPEQWEDAASVDARSDLYALGILAYEALIGNVPFSSKALDELAQAHRSGAPPPVPGSLPPALDAVFARALAKAPADRFEDALALGAAFRRASSLGAERPALPRLDEAIRERYLADAPQPIAEAVAMLDRARELRQARDALWAVTGALAHYLGLLALCSASRFRGLGSAAPPALRRAGAQALSAEEWLEVAEALTAGRAERPELHPLPELAHCLGRAADCGARLRGLWHLREPLASAAAGDEALHETLREAISQLSGLLRVCEFICDYALVVPLEPAVGTCWTGLAGARTQTLRKTRELRGAPLRPGAPAVCDAEGAPILSLHPLVQVLRPTPDAPEELFFFAGGSARGGKLVAVPMLFERHDQEVFEWLRLQLDTSLDSREGDGARERPPYRGLEAYGEDDASLYVGRERDVDAFTNKLRLEPLLAVVGPSGAGKSSFVQAGVIPALRERDPTLRALVVRPGASPLAALESRLVAAGFAARGLAARLANQPGLLGDLLRDDAAAHGPIIVVVDQFEETFTLTKSEEERRRFAEALVGAACVPDDPVRVVLTLRDDFLVQSEGLPPLQRRLSHALQLLTTPGPDELERILVEPAERAGYAFEDPELPARMVAEVGHEPGALALLSFTAAKLWDARDRHFQRLPTRAYEDLGGVAGALAHHAEALLESLPQAERRLVRDAFRLLVTSEGTRAVLGRGELVTALGGGAVAEAAVEHVVKGRLLVVSEGEGGEQIEVAHEALLSAWPRLVEWRREDAEGARFRDQLRAAAVQWDRRGRPRGLLWRDDPLAEYRLWRARYRGGLTPVEDDFGADSLADERRGRRRQRFLVAGAFAVLSAGLAVLFAMSQRAEEARAIAEEQRQVATERAAEIRQQLVDSYLEQGSRALRNQEHFHALVFLAEAFELGADGPEDQFMLSMAAAPLDQQIATARYAGNAWLTAFSPDGSRLVIATSEGIAYIRDGHSGALVHELRGHRDEVYWAAWSPDGAQLATASFDGTARIWDAGTGEARHVLDHEGEKVVSVTFDPEGARLLTGTVAGRLRIFQVTDGREVATVEAHRRPIWRIAIAPGGREVVTGGEDGGIRRWDLDTGAARGELGGHRAAVHALRYDAAGEKLLSTSMNGTARIWDAETGALRAELRGHEGRVTAGDFSPDGRRVATASSDGTARIWSASTGEELTRLEGHRGTVANAAFRGDGAEVLTSGDDGAVRLWDPRTGGLLAVLPTDVRPIGTAHYSSDGARVVAKRQDGTVVLWSVSGAAARIFEHEGPVESVRYAESGDRLVTACRDGAARVWDAERGVIAHVFRHEDEPPHRADIAAGDAVVTAAERGQATLWAPGAASPRLWVGAESSQVARFSPSGDAVLTGGESPALWDVETGRQLLALSAGGATVYALGFTRDDTRILLAGQDGSARVLDAERGDLLATLEGHSHTIRSIRASRDGRVAATASRDGTARLWELATGDPLAVLNGHDGELRDVDISPDGALVATAGEDRTVRLWGVATGRQLARLDGHRREVSGVSFSPDGEHLATSSFDGTVRQWTIPRRAWSGAKVRELTRCLPLALRDGSAVPVERVPEDC